MNGTNIPASGYQPGATPNIFRAEVPNLTPPPTGTTTPDIYEPVRVTQAVGSQPGVPLTVDDPIQYVPPPVESLTYDADGNLKTDGRWTYTWDAADRLVRMESTAFTQPASTTPPLLAVTVPARVIEFAYDGLSRRIRKKVTEGGSSIVLWEAYVYDGWNMVLSVKLNPAAGASQGRPQSAIASYVWGPDLGSKPFARRDWQAAGGVRGLILANYFTGANGGSLHAPGMDAMGNVTSVTRLGVASTYGGPYFRNEFVYDYDAFGKEMRSSTLVAGLNPDSFPFHYSTKFTDPESGFNYYGYRFYDPANGRWINRDPIEERGGINIYCAAKNNIVTDFDRLGLHSFEGCSPDQQQQLGAAAKDAQEGADSALNKLDATRNASNNSQHPFGSKDVSGNTLKQDFEKSFGALSPDAIDQVEGNFEKTKKKLSENITFECKCSCEKPTWGAYVFPGGENKVFVCPHFWDGANKGRMLLHEMTHEGFGSKDGFDLDGNGRIEDAEGSIYGQDASESLAKHRPELARNHADSYSFYAFPLAR